MKTIVVRALIILIRIQSPKPVYKKWLTKSYLMKRNNVYLKNNYSRKKWAKHLKLSPIFHKLSKNIGKAPKCNVNGPKKEIAVTVDSKGKKKK